MILHWDYKLTFKWA